MVAFTGARRALLGGHPLWVPAGALVVEDWANDRYYGPRSTIVRAAPPDGYAATSGGIYMPFGADTFRRTDAGLTIEPTWAEKVRNNSLQGAGAGSPGVFPSFWDKGVNGSGLVWSVPGIGTESGIDCGDFRLSGTAASSTEAFVYFEPGTVIPAAQGQTWTLSPFMRVVAGSLTNINLVRLRHFPSSGGAFNSPDIKAALSAATLGAARQSYAATYTDAGIAYTRAMFAVTHAAGPVDITFRVGLPSFGQGAVPLTPVRTTGAVQTRQADAVILGRTGIGRVDFLFADGSTQTVTGIDPSTPYTIPTNLNRAVVRSWAGYAA